MTRKSWPSRATESQLITQGCFRFWNHSTACARPRARVFAGGVVMASLRRTLWFHSPIRLAALHAEEEPFAGSML